MNAKPIPFRKPKRKPGDMLARPAARIIPARSVAVVGETVIRTLVPRERHEAA